MWIRALVCAVIEPLSHAESLTDKVGSEESVGVTLFAGRILKQGLTH
jgi:hypothetical protein